MFAITFALSPGFLLLGLVALGVTIFALVDVLRHPEWAWQGSGQSRTLWLVLTIVALFFGLLGLIVDLIYLLAIRPKVVAAQGRGGPTGGSGYGTPYGSGGYSPGPGGYGTPYASPTYPPGPPASGPAGYDTPPGPPGAGPGGYGSPLPPPGYGTPPPPPGYVPPPPPAAAPPPGWYPDPAGSGHPRYWNGQSWAEDTPR